MGFVLGDWIHWHQGFITPLGHGVLQGDHSYQLGKLALYTSILGSLP